MTACIATLCDTLVQQLFEALPFAYQLDPTDGGEACIGHELFESEDLHHDRFHSPPALRLEDQGGLWTPIDSLTSQHQRLRLIQVRTSIEETFHALSDALGDVAPVLALPFQRLSFSTWNGNDKPSLQICLFGFAPRMLHTKEGTPGQRLARLAEVVAPLDTPTHLYTIETDASPIPAQDALQAAMLWAIIAGKKTELLSPKDAALAARHISALPRPDEIEASLRAFARKGRLPNR